MLFMPGDDLHKIQKGATLSLDSLIMDLVDGVSFGQKEVARQTVCRALQSVDFGGREHLVRINAVGSGLEMDDLAATIKGYPDGYVIPKVDSAAQVTQVANWLTSEEVKLGWAAGSILLFAIIESSLGVVNLKEIATSTERLAAIMFGAEDLSAAIGGIRTPSMQEVMYARSAVVIHANAYDLQAIDTPYVEIDNLEGLAQETQIARQMGYDGKLVIHPKHIPIVEAAFTPTLAEVDYAETLMHAYAHHLEVGAGVFTFQGKMIDMPMIRAARNVLGRAGKPSE